jgi:radical SAM protein with 4Fe4S-binding SPASM domain
MTSELFYKILDEIKTHHNPSEMCVAPSYAGESMLHPKFEEFVLAMHAMGFREVQIATNGTCLNKHMNKVLLKAFDSIAISVHKQPGMGRVLLKARQLYAMRKGEYPRMRLNIVAEEFTQNDLNMIAVKMRGYTDGVKIITYISEDMKTAQQKPSTWPVCMSMSMYMAVLWNGETLPCCHILSPGNWTLGNVEKTSLQAVFKGRAYAALRSGELAGTPCEGCEVRG